MNMIKETKLYVIRHGEARGNKPNDPLTPKGEEQVKKLIDFLLIREEMKVDQMISSPYLRATQTADILNNRLNIGYNIDTNLRELDFGVENGDIDFADQLEKQFKNFDLKLSGGESNQEVMNRVSILIDKLLLKGGTFILVTHRVTLALLLRYFDDERFGFNECISLTNPDAFVVTLTNHQNILIEDIW
ncbi:histidine phosphatase family protein [Bacillus subtilis]|nr:histidine phosphatase family protein [Bacillus subtilis]